MGRRGGRLMAALALSDLLPDFGSRVPRALAQKHVEPAAARLEPVLEPPRPSDEDIAERIAEAVTKAEASVTERLSEIYEATLQAERDHHAAESDDLRRALGTEAAAMIEARFAAMEEQITRLTTTAAARILGALLTEEI